jgi:NADPH-dependent 2,4-dienoyl-CoA reductase/sulfur reductase-like enzyme
MHEKGYAEVVIAGGGVAAAEAMIALHGLAPERIHVTIVSPGPRFVPPAMKDRESFAPSHVADTVVSVDAAGRAVRCAGGRVLHYDSLILALGCRAVRCSRTPRRSVARPQRRCCAGSAPSSVRDG